jgi:hypothetical protein
VSGAKAGCETSPGRQIGASTLRDRLRNLRKRKQSHDGLLAENGAKQPQVGGLRKKRDD